MTPPILAEVMRGGIVESVHRGHICIVDGNGERVASVGEPETVTFFRSAAKPFQAMPFLTSGAADAFGFTDKEIALACASHSGEKIHVEGVRQMLEKLGYSEADLRCGVHLPFYQKEAERMIREGESPTQLHNNCSGKHTAMLGLAKHIGADIRSYESSADPVQQAIVRCVAEFTDVPAEKIGIGIDGCAAPNFAIPISAMARSFANLVLPKKFDDATQKACRRVVSAMVKFPHLIGGTDRLDTILMKAAPGKMISKVGADGVWLCGVLPNAKYPTGLGIALKIEDGDDLLSRPVVAVQILKQLGILDDNALLHLSPMPIKNRRGDIVGKIEAVVP
ncbi:MAG TPA: asparaginase [Pyrinomonadaceae bacterium]|nr:asparaginase [Pyrinomonadaceae bacterium]